MNAKIKILSIEQHTPTEEVQDYLVYLDDTESNAHRRVEDYPGYDIDPEVLTSLKLPKLPSGFGFVGGAARAVAQKVLFNEVAPIRDIDIVAFEEFNPQMELADKLSRQYMPDDYAYGNGVKIERLSEYFTTRDFTLNEVAVVNNRILITDTGYSDLKSKTVRPTSYETHYYSEGRMGPKIAIKSLLLHTVLEHQYGQARDAYSEYMPNDINDFYIALGLNKAFQYGEEVAFGFVDKLQKHHIINDDFSNPYELAIDLDTKTDFKFRGSDAANRITTFWETPSTDLAHPPFDDPDYLTYADKANRFNGRGRQYVGRDEY